MPNVRKKNLIIKSIIAWKWNHLFTKKFFRKKKIIVRDLSPAAFSSFVVQWLVKIPACRPQLTPLRQNPRAPHIEVFLFQSQIHLILQNVFCLRGRRKTNNWLNLLFHNEKVYEAICYDDLQYQMLFVSQQRLYKQGVYYLLPFQYFLSAK